MSFITITASLMLPLVSASISFYTNTTVPSNITTACSNALTTEVDCDVVVPALITGNYYQNTTLIRACTSECTNALGAYKANIDVACASDTWLAYDNETMPVAIIPEILNYNYNLTCLTDDDGRFCNNVAAAYATYLDGNATTNDIPAMGMYGEITVTDECDICFIKNMKFQAEKPYYDGPEIWSSSLYQSKTSSCGVTGMPLTLTTNTILTATTGASATTTAVSGCAGTSYTIQDGDDCNSISLAMGISTSWLLTDNDLTANCVNFPTSGDLCLVNTCDVYTVQLNDTCSSIVKATNITQAQLKAWNPSIDAGCYNIDNMIGDQLCISKPGGTYTMPASITATATSASTTAAIPTNVASDTNTRCAEYYSTVSGDYCNLILLKYSISLDTFLFLNPSVNENCTNLWAETSYCVEAVGDIRTYSGQAGYITASATYVSLAGDPATTWPTINYTTPTATTTDQPLATDTRSDCWQYFNGTRYIGKVTGDSYLTSDCDLAAHVFDVSLEDLGVWNPSLNTSDSDCTFESGKRYCGQYYFGDITQSTVNDTSDSPLRDGTLTNCTEYLDVYDGSDYTCEDILTDYDITIAEFYAWNPAVNSDCSNLQLGYQYCVSITSEDDEGETTSSSTFSSTATILTTTSSPTAPAPTQTGQPANCNEWYVAQSGDGCYDIAADNGITLDEFYEWNPAVGTDCANLWPDEAYCIGISTSSAITTTATSSPTSTSSATATSVTPPAATQTGIISTCNKYAVPTSGEACDTFYEENNITKEEFFEWNTAVEDCATDFWADTAYCIGVSDS